MSLNVFDSSQSRTIWPVKLIMSACETGAFDPGQFIGLYITYTGTVSKLFRSFAACVLIHRSFLGLEKYAQDQPSHRAALRCDTFAESGDKP
jgi:hypothetical protein